MSTDGPANMNCSTTDYSGRHTIGDAGSRVRNSVDSGGRKKCQDRCRHRCAPWPCLSKEPAGKSILLPLSETSWLSSLPQNKLAVYSAALHYSSKKRDSSSILADILNFVKFPACDHTDFVARYLGHSHEWRVLKSYISLFRNFWRFHSPTDKLTPKQTCLGQRRTDLESPELKKVKHLAGKQKGAKSFFWPGRAKPYLLRILPWRAMRGCLLPGREKKVANFLFFCKYCLDDTIFSVIVLFFGGQVESNCLCLTARF